MIGKLSLFLICFFTTYVYIYHPIVEAKVQEQEAQVWACLQNNLENKNSIMPESSVMITLKGSGQKNATQYAVLCTTNDNSPTITIKKGVICTTGYAKEDISLFGDNNVGAFSPTSWRNSFGTSKITMQKNGSITTSGVLENPYGHRAYSFYAISRYDPVPTVTLKNQQSMQLGIFEIPTLTPNDNASTCSSIRWDPYGVVFDSQSLEPIPNIQISLLESDNIPVSLPGLDNPSKPTKDDGAFNFLANPGIYLMDPITPQGYSFSKTPKINPNWSKIYTDLYHPGDSVDERKGPIRKDIPLDPGNNKFYTADPVISEDYSMRLGLNTKFLGYVSHPLSTIVLVGKISGKEYARASSDKNGFWQILLNNSLIPQNEQLIPKAIKADIYGNTKLINMNNIWFGYMNRLFQALSKSFFVSAQSKSSSLTSEYSPILTYIEGYAYDNKNNILPHIPVYIKLDSSREGIYYQTETDSNGFFSIPSQFLPIFPYHLEYIVSPDTAPTIVTTDQFVRENKAYLGDKKLDLIIKQKYETANSSPSSILEASKPSVSVVVGSPTQYILQDDKQKSNDKNRSQLFILILFLVAILGIAAIGIIYYWILKHKKDPDPPQYFDPPLQ